MKQTLPNLVIVEPTKDCSHPHNNLVLGSHPTGLFLTCMECGMDLKINIEIQKEEPN